MHQAFPNPALTSSLSPGEIAHASLLLCDATVDSDSKGAFLLALNQRGESAEELAGFAREFLSQAVVPIIENDEDRPLVELCGTGGDKAGLLNISTAAMFVVAGAGGRVVKHGNRAVSSRCGSADVLEALGVTLHLEVGRISTILDEAGCVFLLASDFHPAVAAIARVRRALGAQGKTTIFNLLGPLLNPAMPEYQLAGVYRREMLSRYATAMGLLGRKKSWAVHGEGIDGGGIDELTVTGCSHVVSSENGMLRNFTIAPEEAGFSSVHSYEGLTGGDAIQNAHRILSLISGAEHGAARDMILLNAGAALHLSGKATTLLEGMEQARESVDSGRASAALERLRAASAARF
jgi:anthranilate phosphoribosyltransferase